MGREHEREEEPRVCEKSLPRRWERYLWERGRLARPGINAGTGEQRSERPALPS